MVNGLVEQKNEEYYICESINLFNTNKNDGLALAEKGISLYPQSLTLLSNMGTFCFHLGLYKKAAVYLGRKLELTPDSINDLLNLGCLQSTLSNLEDARSCFEMLLCITPGHKQAIYNLGRVLLKLNLSPNGWKHFLSVVETDEGYEKISKNLCIKKYAEGKLEDQHLLLYCVEHGFGDSIQFIRYVKLLKNIHKVREITVVCPTELYSLFLNLSEIDNLYSCKKGEVLIGDLGASVDSFIMLFGVPRILSTTVDSIPNELPYLKIDQKTELLWKERVDRDTTNVDFKIGVVWKSGGGEHSLSSLKMLAPLWRVAQKIEAQTGKRIAFVNLQKGDCTSEIADFSQTQPMFDFSSEVNCFNDTGAIIKQLNLVISIDTSVTHLVGALNVPCWVLLRSEGDWRWGLHKDKSDWYPDCIRLFRQPPHVDGLPSEVSWDVAIENMANQLQEKLEVAFYIQ